MWYKNVGTSFFRFVTMHEFDSSYVRRLGVTIAANLGLDRHVSNICKTCFYV